MRSKKGQAEDIFSDLIPAIIFLIIGLILIAKVDSQSKTVTDKLMQNNIVADRMAALMVFKSPMDAKSMVDFVEKYFAERPPNYKIPLDAKAAADAGFSGNFIDFMNRLRLIKGTDTENIQKLKDTKLAEFFSYAASAGEVEHSSSAAFMCRENLYWYMYEYLLDGDYNTWIVRVYEEDAKSNKDRLLFICTSQMYKYKDNSISRLADDLEKDTKGCFAENTQRFDRSLLFGSLGGKGNSVDRDPQMFSVETRFPTPDPSKVLVGFVDYSRNHCPLNPSKERIYVMEEMK